MPNMKVVNMAGKEVGEIALSSWLSNCGIRQGS